jgi:hypothetical protein
MFTAYSAAPAAGQEKGATHVSLTLTSQAFSAGGEVPKRNSCDGEDLSPQLSWSHAPAGAKSLALIVDDPDAPVGTFTHWVLYNLAPATSELPEGVSKGEQAPGGGSQGRNDFGRIGYGGPCPPPGKPHRYYFRLFALDTVLGLKPGASRAQVEKAMQGHVLEQGEIVARYRR